MKKARCQLCGGKTKNGVCTLCGWRNQTILEDKIIEESDTTDYSGFQATEEDVKNILKDLGINDSDKARKIANNYNKVKGKKSGKGVLFLLLAIVLAFGGYLLYNARDNIRFYQNDFCQTVEEEAYNYVTHPLSSHGEYWEENLTGGDYIVGIDIPEGLYEITIEKGSQFFDLVDDKNGIYTWVFLNADVDKELSFLDILFYKGDLDAKAYKNVRLYDGATLSLGASATLNFKTENAQIEAIHGVANEMKEEPLLEDMRTYVVGEDLSPGRYDAVITEEYVNLSSRIPAKEKEENSQEKEQYYAFSIPDGDSTGIYKNIMLEEGMILLPEGGDITLHPSEIVPDKSGTNFGEQSQKEE